MTDKAVIQGNYADLKYIKTRSVVQVVVEVPIERANEVTDAFGWPQPGKEIPLALARLDPAVFSKPAKEKTPFKELPLTQQAAMLCKEVAFQRWLGLKNCTEADAKSVVYGLCRIKSLSELNSNLEAGEFWAGYCKQYIDETHLPEQR